MRSACQQIMGWCVLFLLLLSGCTSLPAQPPSTQAGPTPTATLPPAPADTLLPYLPHDHDPFQATFMEDPSSLYTYNVPCPPSPRPTDVCWHVAGSGNSIPYGSLTFTSFDINFSVPGKPSVYGNAHPDFCEPTTRQASIIIGKDTIRVMASGTWCMKLVHFAYHVTGGTGVFGHTHGTGSILIVQDTYPQPILEYWTGTLTP